MSEKILMWVETEEPENPFEAHTNSWDVWNEGVAAHKAQCTPVDIERLARFLDEWDVPSNCDKFKSDCIKCRKQAIKEFGGK